jgi:hypothetical protein
MRNGIRLATVVFRPRAGQGHESALHFRAYTGEITINTPMSDTRSGGRP